MRQGLSDPRILSLTFVLGMILFIRIAVLGTHVAPPSEDLAGDLLVLRSHLGDSPRPEFRFHAPPVYYIGVLLPLLQLLPTFEALKASVALGATLIGVPFYFLGRRMTGSHAAALFAAGLFSFSEGFNEMIGWGGALNLWGIFFSLWTVFFYVREVERPEWRWRGLAVTGIALSLTVGTHPLSAVFTALSLSFLALATFLMGGKKFIVLKKSAAIAGIAAILSIPYFEVYWFLVTNQVNTGPTANGYGYLGGWVTAPFVMARTALAASVLIAVIGIGLVYVRRAASSSPKLLVLSTFAGALSLSPLLNPLTIDRAFYFVAIPSFLSVGFFASGLLRRMLMGIPPERADPPSRPLRSREHAQYVSVVANAIAVASVLSVSSFGHLVAAVDYYSYLDQDAIAGLQWISSSTPKGAILYAEYNGLGTWIEGYAGRKSFQPKPALYIVTARDLVDVQVANVMHAGNLVLENRYLVLGEFAPAGNYNPVLYIRTPGFFAPLLASSDDSNRVSWSNVTGGSGNLPLTSAPRKTVQGSWSNATGAGYDVTYEWDFANLTRTVRMGTDEGWEFQVSLDMPSASNITLDMAFPLENYGTIVESRIEQRTVSLKATFGGPMSADLQFSLKEYDADNPQLSVHLPSAIDQVPSVGLKIGSSKPHMDFVLRIASSRGTDTQTAPTVSDYVTLLETMRASHIVVDKRNLPQYVRFRALAAVYPTVYENERVLILDVR